MNILKSLALIGMIAVPAVNSMDGGLGQIGAPQELEPETVAELRAQALEAAPERLIMETGVVQPASGSYESILLELVMGGNRRLPNSARVSSEGDQVHTTRDTLMQLIDSGDAPFNDQQAGQLLVDEPYQLVSTYQPIEQIEHQSSPEAMQVINTDTALEIDSPLLKGRLELYSHGECPLSKFRDFRTEASYTIGVLKNLTIQLQSDPTNPELRTLNDMLKHRVTDNYFRNIRCLVYLCKKLSQGLAFNPQQVSYGYAAGIQFAVALRHDLAVALGIVVSPLDPESMLQHNLVNMPILITLEAIHFH
jgi:hypothetical protein